MVVSFKSCLGKRNRSRPFPRGPLGFALGEEIQVSALLWPSQYSSTPALILWPESPETPPTCCRLTETIAVTQHTLFQDGCLSRPRAQLLGPQAPQSPPSPGKNPAGWVGEAPPTGWLRSGTWKWPPHSGSQILT